MGSIWTLLYAPLAARTARVRAHGRGPRPGLTILDWGLALGLGLCVSLLCSIWLTPFTVLRYGFNFEHPKRFGFERRSSKVYDYRNCGRIAECV